MYNLCWFLIYSSCQLQLENSYVVTRLILHWCFTNVAHETRGPVYLICAQCSCQFNRVDNSSILKLYNQKWYFLLIMVCLFIFSAKLSSAYLTMRRLLVDIKGNECSRVVCKLPCRNTTIVLKQNTPFWMRNSERSIKIVGGIILFFVLIWLA